jgi:hypothetical protein
MLVAVLTVSGKSTDGSNVTACPYYNGTRRETRTPMSFDTGF